jgi:CO/xanthine dehydrogenase FAD-binding subunit
MAVKPPPFEYVAPATVPQALEALRDYGEDGKVLAGGQSLVPLLNMRLAQPSVLIDVNGLADLSHIQPRSLDDREGISFGAVTRQRTVEDDSLTRERLPLLAEAIGWVGHPQIRNRGTIGGSLAHADPAAELPLVVTALEGIIGALSTRGKRAIPASEFFVYALTPALEPDELLVDVWLPVATPRTGYAFLEVARRHGDFALVAAATSLTLDERGIIGDVRIVIGGAAPTPVRAQQAEEGLRGERAALDAFRRAGTAAAGETEPTSDIHADAEYRRDVAATLVERALTAAFHRVPEGAE